MFITQSVQESAESLASYTDFPGKMKYPSFPVAMLLSQLMESLAFEKLLAIILLTIALNMYLVGKVDLP